MQAQPLSAQVALRILDHIRRNGLVDGDRLPERALAEELRVSRSPVREALRILAGKGAVLPLERGGYAVRHLNASESRLLTDGAADGDEAYFAIADDRFSGRLPDRVTENQLMRRYGLSRGHLAKLLRRIASEGWLERLPGHGWAFVPTLTSGTALEHSYLFRLEIEPAAILQPTFVLDRPGLERCRAQQIALRDNGIAAVSPAELFDANTLLHETVARCSGNPFFLDALKRINQLRRLVAYRRLANRPEGVSQFGEHLEILELLLEGAREAAAKALRRHLEGARSRPMT